MRADSRFAPSQWEMSLQNNSISHWLGANLESALHHDIDCEELFDVKWLKLTHSIFTGVFVLLEVLYEYYSDIIDWPYCRVKWYHKTWSTLVQAVSSCLMSTTHYLYHCWLFVTWTIWNILEWIFSQNAFKKMYLKMLSAKCQSLCSGLSRIMIGKLHHRHQTFSTIYSLKWKCYHYDEIFIYCTGSFQMPIFNGDSDTNFLSITTLPFQCTNWNLSAELRHQSPLYVAALYCRQVS